MNDMMKNIEINRYKRTTSKQHLFVNSGKVTDIGTQNYEFCKIN